MDEPETPGLALFRACNPDHPYNAYWGMVEESRQVYETRAERFLESDFVARQLREIENRLQSMTTTWRITRDRANELLAERDDLTAKLDRVRALCDRYPLVGEGRLRAILDAPTTGDSQ